MSIDTAFDQSHIWHPYTSMTQPLPVYGVINANKSSIQLDSGEWLIDGMSSWWSVIHGYNHLVINQAIEQQLHQFAHVMFGGLTHAPAVDLCKKLIQITPNGLNKVFLADSGSVSVEVAIKMAIQYWQSQGCVEKDQLLALTNGYHGDTIGAMSVCDPVTGMHSLFAGILKKNLFAPAPVTGFDQNWDGSELVELEQLLATHHHKLAALIVEPVVQGAGGMRIYHPSFLAACRRLCDQYGVLFIVDEIATGFGRTGKLFACEWADVTPDILCLGKALTGGYMTLAATLCTDKIATGISQGQAGVFMHGPTFMANPLACAAANASIDLLLSSNWQQRVQAIEQNLKSLLLPLANHARVSDVRVLGAIGVVECQQSVNMAAIQRFFVEHGVWIRPFGKLIYIMPPFIIEAHELTKLGQVIAKVLDQDACFNPRAND